MTNEAPHNRLIEIIESMADKAVLVVGDIMLDRFVYGHVERISPESPVPVLSITREERMLGGAGNALANLAGLHVKAKIIALTGEDADGRTLATKLEKLGIATDGLITDAARPTIVKTRFLAGHQQLLRTDFEKKIPIDDSIANDVLAKAATFIKDVGALIISDYGKGLLRKDVIKGLIDIARKNNVPVIVDPKGADFSIYKGASAVTPNKKELSEAVRGAPTSTDEDVVAAAEKIIAECGIDAVIATRSKDGMSVIQRSQSPLHLRTEDIEVFDVSGAGDAVIATIAAALAAGASLEEAATLANTAGSIVVTKVGTAPIRAQELKDGLSEKRMRQAELMDWHDAAEQVKRWRAKGLKIGFTNGCFDILHYGHVSYLNDARRHCDRLIVGLNRDNSVKILKGEGRPVHTEDSRAAVLGALGAVDMVVLFGAEKTGDDNTAIAVLEQLKPDVYFKGGDYTENQIPEAPTVKSYGGEVQIMPVYDGHSTTSSVKKIKSNAA